MALLSCSVGVLAGCGHDERDNSSSAASTTITAKIYAEIGEAGARVSFPEAVNGADFYRSTDADCDLANYALCADGALDILDGSDVDDMALTLSQPAYYWLARDGAATEATAISTTRLPYTNGDMVSFKGRMILLADGVTDIWAGDGLVWEQITPRATQTGGADAFSALDGFTLTVFNDKLWLIGGATSSSYAYQDDVWVSEDGITWDQANGSPGFYPVAYHQVVVKDGYLWLIGGETDATAEYADDSIWRSANGVDWELVTATPEDASGNLVDIPVSYQAAAVKDGYIWLISGYRLDYTDLDEVWRSADGKVWEKVVDGPLQSDGSAAWPATYGATVTVYNDQFYLVGGGGQTATWVSSDGVTWDQIVADSAATRYTSLTIFDDELYWFGSNSTLPLTVLRDNSWLTVTPYSNLPAEGYAVAACLDNDVHVLDGAANDKHAISTSGYDFVITSTQTTDLGALPAGRTSPLMVRHSGYLYLLGGGNGASLKDDVWRSPDGITWELMVEHAGFAPRTVQAVTSYNGKLWIMGGIIAGTRTADIWNSDDGSSWSLVTSQPKQADNSDAIPAQSNGVLFAFLDKLWFVGGRTTNSSSSAMNDIWSSLDGVTWTLETDTPLQTNGDPAFGGVVGHTVTVFDNKVWLITGSKVWVSDDAVTWDLASDGVLSGTVGHSTCATDQGLYLIAAKDNRVWHSRDGNDWRLLYSRDMVLQ